MCFACGCAHTISLLHNEVSALSWLEKIISHFFHASWCLCQLHGWAHTMITHPDHSQHLHVSHPLDQGRGESVTQRNSGAGKGTQMPPIEWMDSWTKPHSVANELKLTRDLWEQCRQRPLQIEPLFSFFLFFY